MPRRLHTWYCTRFGVSSFFAPRLLTATGLSHLADVQRGITLALTRSNNDSPLLALPRGGETHLNLCLCTGEVVSGPLPACPPLGSLLRSLSSKPRATRASWHGILRLNALISATSDRLRMVRHSHVRLLHKRGGKPERLMRGNPSTLRPILPHLATDLKHVHNMLCARA
jgi:hypothetical protein